MSRFIEDLTQATNLFTQGMQKLATTQAVNRANDQLAEINASALSDAERKAATFQLAQQFALNLTGAGLNPQEVAATTSFIAPSAAAQRTMEFQAEQQQQAQQARLVEQEREQTFQAGEAEKDRRFKSKLMKAQAEASIPKLADVDFVGETVPDETSVRLVKQGIADTKTVMDQLTELQELVNSVGFETLPTEKRGRMRQLSTNIQTLLKGKSFADLGVLQGQDLELLLNMIPDPTSWTTRLTSTLPEVRAQLQASREYLHHKLNSTLSTEGFKIKPGSELAASLSRGPKKGGAGKFNQRAVQINPAVDLKQFIKD